MIFSSSLLGKLILQYIHFQNTSAQLFPFVSHEKILTTLNPFLYDGLFIIFLLIFLTSGGKKDKKDKKDKSKDAAAGGGKIVYMLYCSFIPHSFLKSK